MSDYVYETTRVSKGRKTKWCDNESCNKRIDIGEPSITITAFQGEFAAYSVCSDKCETEFIKNYGENEDS